MIAKEVRELLFLPDYYTDEYNATPMKNYWPFLKNLIEIINPRSICEIGSERGLTSKLLIDNFPNISLYIVDPFISNELKKNRTKNLKLYEEKSLDFLKRNIEIELYFIDGDHNYYTVKNELINIEKNRRENQKTFILLHDVSWFCGRRDQYYNENTIPEKHDSFNSGAICLENDGNSKYGFRLDKNFTVSKSSGGSKNGVLTAIEDFVKESDLNWNFSYIPSLWGLGFLWLEDNFTEQEVEEINIILKKLDSLKEFFGILEANRLRLLQGLDEWQGLAEERLSELHRLGKERDELYQIAEERLSELHRLGKERDELYQITEQQSSLINRLKKNFFLNYIIKYILKESR